MNRVFLLILFLLALLVFRFYSFYASHPPYKSGQDVSIGATLGEEPDLSNKGQSFSIKTSTNQIIFVKTAVVPRLHYGEKVVLKGRLESRVLSSGHEILTMQFPKIVAQDDPLNFVTSLALSIRQRSTSLFERTLPPTSASLLSGIVFGAKEHFSIDFKDSLRSTGVLHVIAASGMNVTFVAAALLATLGHFMRRQFALIFGALAIIFYVFLVGFEPSIVRAAIMALLAFGAGILGRQNWALFSIFLAGYMMLLWQPVFLTDVGFQLSFLATLGILLLDKSFGKLGKLGILGESVSTTLAAQVATMPILLGAFGSLGMLSLPVNAMVLWTVPILMTLGSLSVLVMFVFEPLAKLLLFLALPFLLFFEAVVSFLGGLGWNFQIESFPWQMGVGYYLVVIAIIVYFKRKTKSEENLKQ